MGPASEREVAKVREESGRWIVEFSVEGRPQQYHCATREMALALLSRLDRLVPERPARPGPARGRETRKP